MRILISILSILAVFSFTPNNAFAAGQACCNPGFYTGLTGPSLNPSLCCNSQANTCVSTQCGATEGCSNNICTTNVPATLPPCTTHQQCNTNSYSGCMWNGQFNYCTLIPYPTVPPSAPSNPTKTSNVLPRCGPDNKGINTAIGCISTDFSQGGFIGSILRISVGIGGGIALLLMLYGTFIITTSAGNPDKLKAGNEIITSAIVGLIFIILSVVLMELIGVSILGIPGL